MTTGTQTINAEGASQGQNMDPSTTNISEPSNLTLKTQTELNRYPTYMQLQIITSLFQRCASQAFQVTVSDDFLSLVLKASQHLSSCNVYMVLPEHWGG